MSKCLNRHWSWDGCEGPSLPESGIAERLELFLGLMSLACRGQVMDQIIAAESGVSNTLSAKSEWFVAVGEIQPVKQHVVDGLESSLFILAGWSRWSGLVGYGYGRV